MNTQPAGDPRVSMAAERTFLAWIRTGLALMGFGFVVARFGLFLQELASVGAPRQHGPSLSLPIGISLIALGIVVIVTAGFRHHRSVRSIAQGHLRAASGSAFGLAVAAILALIGLVMAFYLATM
jgi:inner membrane protein YidH